MTSATKTRITACLQHAARTPRAADEGAEAEACLALLAEEPVSDAPPPSEPEAPAPEAEHHEG